MKTSYKHFNKEFIFESIIFLLDCTIHRKCKKYNPTIIVRAVMNNVFSVVADNVIHNVFNSIVDEYNHMRIEHQFIDNSTYEKLYLDAYKVLKSI